MSRSVQQGHIAYDGIILDSTQEQYFYFSVIVESVLKSNRFVRASTFVLHFVNGFFGFI